MISNLSVLITCYNKEKYLDDCVASVLRQTKKPREIIVVHDECSEPIHHLDVTSIMLKSNLGVCRARQEAFRYSEGELVLFLDGDDMISPDYLEKMILAIASGADISYPDIYFFGNGGDYLNTTADEVNPALVKDKGKLAIPVTCLMKREVYEALGGFKDFPVMEDLDFWLRAMCKGYTFKKAQTLIWYRQTDDRRNAVEESKKKRIVLEILEQFLITNSDIKLK